MALATILQSRRILRPMAQGPSLRRQYNSATKALGDRVETDPKEDLSNLLLKIPNVGKAELATSTNDSFAAPSFEGWRPLPLPLATSP